MVDLSDDVDILLFVRISSVEHHLNPIIDYDALLTDDWLVYHIFRYIESIADHCQQASIAIVGLMNSSSANFHDQQQQILDEIHSKVNMFVTDENYQRTNIQIYSEYFLRPVYFDDEHMSSVFIEQLESIAQQRNIIHNKHKRLILKQRLGLTASDTSFIMDYDPCQQQFERSCSSTLLNDNNMMNDDDGKQLLVNDEINRMSFDDCLDYLKLTGDIICSGTKSTMTIVSKPYNLLNQIFSRTLFRSHLEQWLNYDDNVIFHFSGYYPTQESFDIDRQRLLTRGEFTWNMLTILFNEQNWTSGSLVDEQLIDYCRLIERLQLGYIVESNLNCMYFT
jgi:hypothetical protein